MALERILIVDDEPPARRHLIRMLRELVALGDVLEAGSVDAAAVHVAAAGPIDAIFLDVQMPRADGFALFERCAITAPVIFVTAFHLHAVRAFEVNALDYLLKPVARDRLAEAVARLARQPRAAPGQPLADEDVVCLRDRGRQSFVRVTEIAWIAAADDYTEVHLATGGSRLCALTMAEWEARLPAAAFVRIHRSTIIGLRHVLELRHAAAGAELTLGGVGEPLRVARAHLATLKQRLVALGRAT